MVLLCTQIIHDNGLSALYIASYYLHLIIISVGQTRPENKWRACVCLCLYTSFRVVLMKLIYYSYDKTLGERDKTVTGDNYSSRRNVLFFLSFSRTRARVSDN